MEPIPLRIRDPHRLAEIEEQHMVKGNNSNQIKASTIHARMRAMQIALIREHLPHMDQPTRERAESTLEWLGQADVK